MIGQDVYRHWQQFDTPPILNSAPQWFHRPCNAHTQFYRVGKKPSVKAYLAIYSHILDVSGQCMSVSLILGIKLDFISCANWDSFCNLITNMSGETRKWVEILLTADNQPLSSDL